MQVAELHVRGPVEQVESKMKQLPLLVSLGAMSLALGCEREAPLVTSGARAQSVLEAPAVEPNAFVGLWTSPPSQTVNHWLVAFTPTGLVAVDGPGMKADGTYRAQGHLAKSAYSMRNGQAPGDPKERETVFQLSEDGKSLQFSTGVPLDPIVKLVRAPDDQVTLPKPSLRQTADPTGLPNPFTLAWLSRVQ
jgi:hypothetical protein